MIEAIKRAYQKHIAVRRTNDVLVHQVGRHCLRINWGIGLAFALASQGHSILASVFMLSMVAEVIAFDVPVSGERPIHGDPS